MVDVFAWIQAHWMSILASLWGLDQVLVSIFGKSTLLDGITSFLKSIGADKPQ